MNERMAQALGERTRVRRVVRLQGPPPNLVKRQKLAFWQKRHWEHRGNHYTGYYRTPAGAYKGVIGYRSAGWFDFYITDPPECLRLHSHYRCFRPRGNGVYHVHFNDPSISLDGGIRAIEKILREAHGQAAIR